MKKPIIIFASILSFASFSHAAPNPPPAAAKAPDAVEKVVDRFEVGPNVYVRALGVEPQTNTMWVGTSAGVHEVDLGSYKVRNTFTRKDGLANEYVFGIGVDKQGYKWFGTNAGGVSRYKDGKWKTYFPMHGLADYWIYTFANQKDGTVWIGTWAGANSFNPKTGKFKTYVKELVNEWVYGLDVDAKDRVWFGTEGGVSMYDGKTWKSWTHKDGMGAENVNKLPASPNTGLGTRSRHDLDVKTGGDPTYNPNYVFSLRVAQDQSVWVGTWGAGVGRYDGKQWKNWSTREGLAGNIVYSMTQDKNGIFWFGTNNGLSRFDGQTFRNYGRKEGLLDDNVYAVAVAPNGDIWVGTKRGVVRMAKS